MSLWVFLSLLLVTPAFAAAPLDMTAVLIDDTNKPIPDTTFITNEDPACTKCPPLTLGTAAYHALFAMTQEEQRSGSVTAEQKWQRAVLAVRIKDDKAATLTAEEIALIKSRIGTTYGGMVVLRAYALLDPTAQPPAIK